MSEAQPKTDDPSEPARRPAAATRERERRWPARLAVALTAALLALVTAELGWRVHRYGWAALSVGGMNSIRPLGVAGILGASDEWELYYELKPDLRTRFKLAPFETNSHGMRDDEVTLAKPPGTVRVAFVGDSFVMGSGVPLEDVFHSRLESQWSATGEGARYECLNFGVGGYGLRSYEAVLRLRALAFEPDLVVVCLTANDRSQPFHRPPGGTYREKPVEHPFWHLHLADRLPRLGGGEPAGRASAEEARQRAAALAKRTAEAGRGASGERATDGPDDVEGSGDPVDPIDPIDPIDGAEELEPAFAKLGADGFSRRERELYGRTQFAALRDNAAAANVPLVVVYLSLGFGKDARKAGLDYRRWAEEAGLAFYDTLPLFRGLAYEELVIFPDDAHPNAASNAHFADGIDRFLRRRGLVPGLARPAGGGAAADRDE